MLGTRGLWFQAFHFCCDHPPFQNVRPDSRSLVFDTGTPVSVLTQRFFIVSPALSPAVSVNSLKQNMPSFVRPLIYPSTESWFLHLSEFNPMSSCMELKALAWIDPASAPLAHTFPGFDRSIFIQPIGDRFPHPFLSKFSQAEIIKFRRA